jgi:hypothetical protein
MSHNNSEHEELMILDHEAVEGYRPVFLVAINIGILYLGYILFCTL